LQLDTGFEDLADFRKEEYAFWGPYYELHAVHLEETLVLLDQGFAAQ
jgi:hypothetical protein